LKKLLLVTAVLAGAAVLVLLNREVLVERLLQRGMAAQFGTDATRGLPDGLHLALCGAGGPLPGSRASGPCVAVLAGERLFIVDAGTDGARNLTRMGYSPGRIEAVLLTHYHSDHIDGLGELATLRWVSAANTRPLPVHGPEGVQLVVEGFNTAYAQDFAYRRAHHGSEVAPISGSGLVARPFFVPEPGDFETVLFDEHLTIEAIAVRHTPVDPAVGYRFTYKDRSLLITGDTVALDSITAAASGVDLLVHDALSPRLVRMMNEAAREAGDAVLARITEDIPDYHASPLEAAKTAREAGVGHLLYYHIVPPLMLPGQSALYLDGADAVFPDYTIGRDGTAFSLPAGSQHIDLISRGL
jgi:ribonuclease Z